MRPFLQVALLILGISMVCAYLCATGDAECRWGMTAEACTEGPFGQLTEVFETIAAMSAAAAAYVALSTFVEARRHGRLSRQLRRMAQTARLAGHEVLLVPGLTSPYVAGLARTRIYCPPDLADRLTEDELRAVILHERHHQTVHAPIQLVILSALCPALELLPGGRQWLEHRRGSIEIAADNHAIANGVPRPVLARALVKLSAGEPGVAVAGYATASELRLRNLLGGETRRNHAASRLALLAVSLLAIAPCFLRGMAV